MSLTNRLARGAGRDGRFVGALSPVRSSAWRLSPLPSAAVLPPLIWTAMPPVSCNPGSSP